MTDPLASPAVVSSERQPTSQIFVASVGKFLLSVGRRFAFPFAPELSRGLDVPLTSITSLIGMNQLAGVVSPLFGPLSDRWGYQIMMLIGISVFSIGMLASGLLPFYWVVFIGIFLAGIGKSIYDPALQAYIGERVPYERRGAVIGLVEMSWAGASFIGIPAAGLLIDRFSWQAPFLVLGGLGLICLAVLGVLFTKEPARPKQVDRVTDLRQIWRQLLQTPAVLGTLGFAFFINIANVNLFVIYGVWLERDFALSVVALGATVTVIGLAEFVGEILTATVADRVGLKRAIGTGAVLCALGYFILPVISQSLFLALAGIFFIFLAFEFTIVTTISFQTEVLPSARATTMSVFAAGVGIGRFLGALLGGALWFWGGLFLIGVTSALLTLVALAFFMWGQRARKVVAMQDNVEG